MRLLGDFFNIDDTWQGSTDDLANGRLVRKVRFNADHFIYKAHFPNSPVTPGVCLIQMAEEMLETVYGKNLILSSSSNIKFRQPITPEQSPVFMFSMIKEENGFLSARISIENDDVQATKMSLKWEVLSEQCS